MARMEITPRELRDIEIHSEIRGYSRDEVNDLLERAAAAIDASNQRVTQLQERLTSAQSESVRTRETEDILHRTLLLAQRAADEAVAEATAKSSQMIDDAEMSASRLVAESPGARQSATAAPVGAGTSEVDVRTLFEQSRDKPAKETTEGAEHGSPVGARAGSAKPIDLAGSEGIDAEILDDDAFFATLR